MSFVKKARNTFIIVVLLLISLVRTSLGRIKAPPDSHADLPGVTQGLLFRHASGPAYFLETARRFPFLRFARGTAPGSAPVFGKPGQAEGNRNRGRFWGPAGRILRGSSEPGSFKRVQVGWRRPAIRARESVSLRFGGPGAPLRRRYAIEFGGTFPYLRLSSAAMGRVGAASEFSPLRTSASADLRVYSMAIGPSSRIHEHGALDPAGIASSFDDCSCSSCISCISCFCCSCDCNDCGGCSSSCGGCGGCACFFCS
jgi:hypothetical protein